MPPAVIRHQNQADLHPNPPGQMMLARFSDHFEGTGMMLEGILTRLMSLMRLDMFGPLFLPFEPGRSTKGPQRKKRLVQAVPQLLHGFCNERSQKAIRSSETDPKRHFATGEETPQHEEAHNTNRANLQRKTSMAVL